MDITLTDEQNKAVHLIKNWFTTTERKFPFILAGLAGTGKTTIIKHITDDLDIKEYQIRYCAYTGKAARVMRTKGMYASTIHSLIYEPRVDKNKVVTFVKKNSLGVDVKLIVCDESSMIGKGIQADLESYNIPILYVGDHGQLPPIGNDATNLMLTPNYRLDTIHRQALDNPIIWVANQARQGKTLKFGKYGKTVFKAKPEQIGIDTLKNADQILVGKNVTRKHINDQMRDYYGFKSIYPELNDKLICLRNNSRNGLVNGMTGKCLAFDECDYRMDFETDEEEMYTNLLVDYHIFRGTKQEKYMNQIDQFDFGYAITVHKSQGSQYDNVIIYEERLGAYDIHNRWLYTAITRAVEKLIIIG